MTSLGISFLIGFAIAAPQLVPQYFLTKQAHLEREVGWAGGIGRGMLAMLLPSPLVDANHPNGWAWGYEGVKGHYYYAGTLFSLLALLQVAVLASKRWELSDYRGREWQIGFAIALLCALGHIGVIWHGMLKLPILGNFTGPSKFLVFVHLYAILSAGLGLERVLRKSPRGVVTGNVLAVITLSLMLYHCFRVRAMNYDFQVDFYPPMPQELADRIQAKPNLIQGRALSFCPYRRPGKSFLWSAWLNWSTAYKVMHFDGYDPITVHLPETKAAVETLFQDPLRAAQAFGIEWLLVHRGVYRHDAHTHNPPVALYENVPDGVKQTRLLKLLEDLLPHAQLEFTYKHLKLYRLQPVAPFAFFQDAPAQGLPIQLRGSSVQLAMPPKTKKRTLTLNFLARLGTQVHADGVLLSHTKDSFGRIVVPVPAGTLQVVLSYKAPWGMAGVGIGLAALGLALLGLFSLTED